MDGQRLPVRPHPPVLGEHLRELLAEIGVSEGDIDLLLAAGVVV